MIEVWRHHRIIGNVVVFGLVGVFLALLLATMARTGGIVSAIRETQINNKAVLNTINDCTQPTGDCYKDGQRRTAGAVSSITRLNIATAACEVVLARQSSAATAHQLAVEISECAKRTVARLDHQASASR